jgi:hypothetical protein
MELCSEDSKCFSLSRERLDNSRDLLTLPCIIPEKGPCEPLAAILLNEARNSVGYLEGGYDSFQ